MQPGLFAVVFLTIALVLVFAAGFFLVYRVMTKPGAHIGARLPEEEPDGEDPDTDGRLGESPNHGNDPDDRNDNRP